MMSIMSVRQTDKSHESMLPFLRLAARRTVQAMEEGATQVSGNGLDVHRVDAEARRRRLG